MGLTAQLRSFREQVPPPMPRALLWFTWLEVFVLLAASVQLFCFPQWEGLRWPWTIRPYNAVFLGGIYWVAVAVMLMQLRAKHWQAAAQLIQPMLFTFSLMLLLVSLAHWEMFDWQRRLVKAWFGVYTLVPLGAATILRRLSRLAQSGSSIRCLSHPLAWNLWFKAAVLSLYGVMLLFLPRFATAFWPWPIDAFHAQLYSAVFFTVALANGLTACSLSALRLRILGWVEILLGLLPLSGVVALGQRTEDLQNWSLTYGLWFTLLAIWGIAGARLILRARAL